LPTGAAIRVIALEAGEEVRRLDFEGRIDWKQRRFEDSDAEDAFMVIAATSDQVINRQVFEAGNRRNRLSNSVDDPDNCNFIMAAITKQGPMQVAVSSAGCSPALAQRVRKRIENEVLDSAVGELAVFLGARRQFVKESLKTYQERQHFWETVIDSDVPKLLRSDGVSAAHEKFIELLDAAAKEVA
jgi:siroheme synthase-like protein